MRDDKLYSGLIDLYRTVYKSLGHDFDKIDKFRDFFLNYEISKEVEDKIVNEFLNSSRLSKLQKQVIKNNYYLGVSPKNI